MQHDDPAMSGVRRSRRELAAAAGRALPAAAASPRWSVKPIEEDILRALIARNEWVESPVFTIHCKQLVEDGYVERKPGRDVHIDAIRITPAGREYMRKRKEDRR
jgi:hypothetical protein